MGQGDQPLPLSPLVHAHLPGSLGPRHSAPEPKGHILPVPIPGLARVLSLDCQKNPRTQGSCSSHSLPQPVSLALQLCSWGAGSLSEAT